ncbi:MAG: type II toxin-antitoxin system VapB family antitoxin [Deltaproteobacteria bacterium]|nr:type II toxin-antitoxin system VapB family antitoxin [Deltaproteobacteria bacterium]
MATNLAIDDHLLIEAQKIGQKPTKKAVVTEALEEYIARRKRLKAVKAFGSLEMDETYHYKKDRQKR